MRRAKATKNIFAHPLDFVRNGGEIIASIPKLGPNGERMNAQVYLLNNAPRARDWTRGFGVQVRGIVSHPHARPRQGFNVVNGLSCFLNATIKIPALLFRPLAILWQNISGRI